jgi:hypothetical protein
MEKKGETMKGAYCPSCGEFKTHRVDMKDSNGLGWTVLRLICECGQIWEMWI